MNERIRELAEQATDKWVGGEFFDREKFAELIVQECANIAKETRWAVPPSQEQIARSIRQHFGVKE